MIASGCGRRACQLRDAARVLKAVLFQKVDPKTSTSWHDIPQPYKTCWSRMAATLHLNAWSFPHDVSDSMRNPSSQA